MATAVELAQERDRLEAEIAASRIPAEERLAAIETELERQSAEEAERRAKSRADYVRIEAAYVEANEDGWRAHRDYVERIERAARLRRELEQTARLRVPA